LEIIVAKHAGFCEGVERAFQIALAAAKTKKKIYMLGDIVHNSQVVAKFKELGVKTIKDLSEIPKGEKASVIISAHGVPPQIRKITKEMHLEIINTTCSWVKRAQELATKLSKEGRQVIILGDKGHPEVEGLKGWAGENSVVVEKASEVEKINLGEKVGLIAQTTQSQENFNEVSHALKVRVKDLRVENTICGATQKRQKAAVELAKKVDLMIVVGDFKSANTKRLTELCLKTGTETVQIEKALELGNIPKGKNKIGVTAGASTPDWIINEVLKYLKNL